jgi:hypothetical protein
MAQVRTDSTETYWDLPLSGSPERMFLAAAAIYFGTNALLGTPKEELQVCPQPGHAV